MSVTSNMIAGYAFLRHYRSRARDRGIAVVAAQMKKQGFPLWLALATLVPGSKHIEPARILKEMSA